MRGNYINNAIGYVEVKREGSNCLVRCQICPEHKIKSKNYRIEMTVNEDTEVVESVKCLSCAASEGGCKHALAFLMWVHEKSCQPAPTSVECYWKKPRLSGVGSTVPFVTAANFGQVVTPQSGATEDFFQEFIEEGKRAGSNSQLLKHFQQEKSVTSVGLHQLLHSFHLRGGHAYQKFLIYAKEEMTDNLLEQAAQETRTQSSSNVWFELRYGRITASKIYDAAHTKKFDGTFVNTIIGAHKIVQTKAMKRGLDLEAGVLHVLENKIKKKIQPSGLLLNKNFPELGASPDGTVENCVVEVKCPSSKKSFDRYILSNGSISTKYNAQIQTQMFFANVKKGLFCVADPNFELNKNVTILHIDYDEAFVTDILGKARKFWKSVIFNRLLNAV